LDLKKSKSLYWGIIFVAIVALMAIVGIFYTPFEPDTIDAASRNLSPSLPHIFGTDKYGRDVFSRCLVGAKTTMLVSLGVVAIGSLIGILVGTVTGYFGGIIDEVIMRINDGLASFPSILLALIFVSLFGSGTKSVVIVLGILFIPSFARVVRSEYKRERDKEYVKCIRLYGAGSLRIMFIHILPNIRQSLFSAIAIGINNAILAEAGLSYLGLGVQPPTASLGRMLSEGQTTILKTPWNCIFPGLVIIMAVLGFSLISDAFESTEGGTIMELKKASLRLWKEEAKATNDTAWEKLSAGEISAGEKSVGEISVGEISAEEISNESEKTEHNKETDIANKKILKMRNLSVAVNTDGSLQEILHHISFDVYEGEILGFVGESGSGKSMTASAIMGLMRDRGLAEFQCEFDGLRLDKLSEKEKSGLRGRIMTQVFQEPMTSLNPTKKIGWQLEEVLRCHKELQSELLSTTSKKSSSEKSAVKDIIYKALSDAGLDDLDRIYESYPGELSGGQRQRALIAMAIIARPKLLICDEPTTALDAAVADRIIQRLLKLHKKYGMTIIFISHDISVIRRLCDRVAVMQDGNIIEIGTTREIYENPQHEYTKRLISASKGFKKTEKSKISDEYVLEVKNLGVTYSKKHLFGKRPETEVITDLSFYVKKGETLGIVGESGSGKTTILKAISDMICYKGTISKSGRLAMVFQDPYSSLNSSMKIKRLLKEVLTLNEKGLTRSEIKARSVKTLEEVGLDAAYMERYPGELSGGQRQRVSIAMAIITRPELILLDEPVTALDVTVSQKILELLTNLKREYGLSYILISHDALLIENTCDRCIHLA
jgi:peptide/nickel transport system permease protein